MKGFGFRLWVAFVCLAASIAQAGNKHSEVSCGWLVSERAYVTAPIGRAAINRALENPKYADRIVKLLEAIAWITDQKKEVWELIAKGLRNGVYNPSPPDGGLGIPMVLRAEKGRAELLRVLDDQFTTPASFDTQEIIGELLDRYPKVPYLPAQLETLGQILSALTLSGATAFYEQKFENYKHAFTTFAAHHWVKFDSSARNLPNRDQIARRTVQEQFTPAKYIQMLHTFMVQFFNTALNPIWTAVSAGKCDMLVIIDRHLPRFTEDVLGRNPEKQMLLREALIFSMIGERIVTGPILRKEVASTFNTYLMDLVKLAQSELPPPSSTTGVTTTTADANAATAQTSVTPVVAALGPQTATTATVSSPESNEEAPVYSAQKPPSANSSRQGVSRRKEKRQQAATQHQLPQNYSAALVAPPVPEYPPLTADLKAALLEGRRNLTSENNISFAYALKLTERLLGPYRISSSHYVFQNPYSDRPLLNLLRHGSDLYPSNGRQLRHLIAHMIEIYAIDEED